MNIYEWVCCYLKMNKFKKVGNWKIEILKIFKFNGNKKISHSRSNLFSSTPKKQSKRIIEAEPTRWLQSKDPWKSEGIRHFN